MRAQTLAWIMTAVSTPVAVGAVIDGADGEGDLWARAEEIARREFSMNASLEIVGIETSDWRYDEFGGKLRPDYGYLFYHATLRLTNTGKMDLAPSTWQFSAIDAAGSDHSALLGGAHHDFDASRLRKGAARMGEVTFELREEETIAAFVWQGDFTNATVWMPGFEPPPPPVEEPPAENATKEEDR